MPGFDVQTLETAVMTRSAQDTVRYMMKFYHSSFRELAILACRAQISPFMRVAIVEICVDGMDA